MNFSIKRNISGHQIIIIDEKNNIWQELGLTAAEIAYAQALQKQGTRLLHFFRPEHQLYLVLLPLKDTASQTSEALRQLGAKLLQKLQEAGHKEMIITNRSGSVAAAYHLAEGITLAAYQFLKYKSSAKKDSILLTELSFDKGSIALKDLKQLQVVCDAIYLVRNLVNEPLQYLTAEQLAKEVTTIGKEGGFRVQVLGKAKIEQLNMGGLLAVNRGSVLPPTFSIMEHRPMKAINKAPIVLVGKGIVYDTGGLSLKPTPNAMDRMKSDMSGAALVTGALYAAAQLELPLHIIGLVPATENRPGLNAYVPGDVIRMYSGTTVEVLNTDAEGRLVLADALHYARKYNPELVLDFATLTGAAATAIGDVGMVCMGTATDAIKTKLQLSGERQHERLVEFPLWPEYGDMIRSDIADLKNIGGPTGGAITAGKFLEHFTAYPWMHFDIAGVSFHSAAKDYRPAGGTAYGLRMLIDFLCNYSK